MGVGRIQTLAPPWTEGRPDWPSLGQVSARVQSVVGRGWSHTASRFLGLPPCGWLLVEMVISAVTSGCPQIISYFGGKENIEEAQVQLGP